MKTASLRLWALPFPLFALAVACADPTSSTTTPQVPAASDTIAFTVLAGSDSKDLEPMVVKYGQEHGATITFAYAGSVDIALQLQSGKLDADAVWPASSVWLNYADRQHVVKGAKSVMRSPVVFGVRESLARDLGWVGNPDVGIDDLLEKSTSGRARIAATSASQSNTGASMFLGVLSAFAGHPEVLTHENLQDPDVQKGTRAFLHQIDVSAGSSGWLADSYVSDPERFNVMVNYEALIIQSNQRLVGQGLEPLYVVYPSDALPIADFPLGYIDHGDAKKKELFDGLQAYLASDAARAEIESRGRRAGLGLDVSKQNPSVFNPDWGIDTARTIAPLTVPSAEVIGEALDLYQTALRKPSLSVILLDVSSSMGERFKSTTREKASKGSLTYMFDPDTARRYLLQPSKDDVSIVIPFCGVTLDPIQVVGNDPDALAGLLAQVRDTSLCGGTGLYGAKVKGLETLEAWSRAHHDPKDPMFIGNYFAAVILLTDGEPTDTPTVYATYAAEHPAATEWPVFAIQFGDADKKQLEGMTNRGKVCVGTDDVGKAMREAKGYN